MVTYDPSKTHEDQNVEQFHAIYFIGTLVNLAAANVSDADGGRWKPKGWVLDSIVSERACPSNEEMNISTLSESTANSDSSGGSTISTKHSSPTIEGGSTISQTIAVATNLILKLTELLEEYKFTLSPNALQRMIRIYPQLLSIPRQNMTKLIDAFTFSPGPRQIYPGTHQASLSKPAEPTKPFVQWKHVEDNGAIDNTYLPVRIETEVEAEAEADITVSTMEVRFPMSFIIFMRK